MDDSIKKNGFKSIMLGGSMNEIIEPHKLLNGETMDHFKSTEMSEIDQPELLKLQETLDRVEEKLDRNYNALLGLIRSKAGRTRGVLNNDKG